MTSYCGSDTVAADGAVYKCVVCGKVMDGLWVIGMRARKDPALSRSIERAHENARARADRPIDREDPAREAIRALRAGERIVRGASRLVVELDRGEWPEDLEPQEVAYLLRELIRLARLA